MWRALSERWLVRGVLALTLVAVAYFLVKGIFSIMEAVEAGSQEEALREQLEAVKARYQALEAVRNYMESDEFIEAMARQYLGLVGPGEVGIVVVAPTPAPTPEIPGPWWEAVVP